MPVITLEQYFGAKLHTNDHELSAMVLLARVENLLAEARLAGAYYDWIDTDTGCTISGSKGGSGDGGFRGPDSKTGARRSAHREAKAVDLYDPHGELDQWITDECLLKHDLYREEPSATPGWCHLQVRPTASGRRTFIP